MGRRVTLVVLLALAVGAGLYASFGSQGGHSGAGAAGVASAPHQLAVVGRQGQVVWNGSVARAVATPFELLQAAAAGNFSVQVRDVPGFGPGCGGVYVVAIAGQGEDTSGGGWNYYVRSAGQGDWSWGPTGAACYTLAPLDAVEWRFVAA